MGYEIRNFERKRGSTKHIIIVPAHFFIEKNSFFNSRDTIGSSKYTWGKWQRYFYLELVKWEMPCHFFVEQLGNDYGIFVGNPEYTPSYFLLDMVKYRLMDFDYVNSIVIGVLEDFTIDIPERRLYEMMASRILVPKILEYKTIKDNYSVHFIDDILNWERLKEVEGMRDYPEYDIRRSKYFSKTDLELYLKKFNKRVRRI